jgi:hypothetical protein
MTIAKIAGIAKESKLKGCCADSLENQLRRFLAVLAILAILLG